MRQETLRGEVTGLCNPRQEDLRWNVCRQRRQEELSGEVKGFAVKEEGVVLQQAACLARCNGARCKVVPFNASSLEEFRERVQDACASGLRHIVASYSRKQFLQSGASASASAATVGPGCLPLHAASWLDPVHEL